jgi:integrase
MRRYRASPSRLWCTERRFGQDFPGPHRLRHTAATEMRRAGVRLTEIGQVLRHRDVQTTALYARDDMEALRSIAAPWPGGVA